MSDDCALLLRKAVLTSLPVDPFQIGAPEPRFLYVPRSHVRALDPDNMLVAGTRGSGKSLWWHALLSEPARAALLDVVPPLKKQTLHVSPGWSTESSAAFPDKDTLGRLRTAGHEARLVWKTVLLFQVAPDLFDPASSWGERVGWVAQNPEPAARRLHDEDLRLAGENAKHLILFDALDRTADAWTGRRELLKGLLQLVLDLRSMRAIRAKAFVRDDLLRDPEVLMFPDASKVMASRVELTWPRTDLYGLLWQHMGNASDGADAFRDLVPGWTKHDGRFQMPERLRSEEPVQRYVFDAIAGNAMGASKKRGIPYTWVPTHLGDAAAIATPRSFLAALRKAAEGTTDVSHALHWKTIQAGVQRASEIRVTELLEDFPWTRPVMDALAGLTVPCDRGEVIQRIEARRVLDAIGKLAEEGRNRRGQSDVFGPLEDLVEIAVLEQRPGDRFNVPDVYRVGFGMKRKGGVKPVR